MRVAQATIPAPGAAQHGAVYAGLCLAAYLYGSLPLVYVLGRRMGVDLRLTGSGNVGSTNLWAAGGAGRSVVGWLGDASKGWVPVIVARRWGAPEWLVDLVGACGVAGQCWPVFLGFQGGRGISAFVGAALAIDHWAGAEAMLPLAGGSFWRVAGMLVRHVRTSGAHTSVTRSKAVPLGCFVGVTVFPLLARGRRLTGTMLALVILVRRLTAPQPDDTLHGPAVQPRALLFRLLYDRNTSR